MKFRVEASGAQRLNAYIVYRPEEYSFDTEPSPVESFTSVLFDDLNLEVDPSNRIVSIWGMCPHPRWIQRSHSVPEAIAGSVFVLPGAPLARGVSVRIGGAARLPVYFDPASGWLCIERNREEATSVQPISGAILQLSERDELCSLWLNTGGSPAAGTG